jgi:hypothetical protein
MINTYTTIRPLIGVTTREVTVSTLSIELLPRPRPAKAFRTVRHPRARGFELRVRHPLSAVFRNRLQTQLFELALPSS